MSEGVLLGLMAVGFAAVSGYVYANMKGEGGYFWGIIALICLVGSCTSDIP